MILFGCIFFSLQQIVSFQTWLTPAPSLTTFPVSIYAQSAISPEITHKAAALCICTNFMDLLILLEQLSP